MDDKIRKLFEKFKSLFSKEDRERLEGEYPPWVDRDKLQVKIEKTADGKGKVIREIYEDPDNGITFENSYVIYGMDEADFEELIGETLRSEKTLEEQLKEAVANEEYEKAAALRNKINSLKNKKTDEGHSKSD